VIALKNKIYILVGILLILGGSVFIIKKMDINLNKNVILTNPESQSDYLEPIEINQNEANSQKPELNAQNEEKSEIKPNLESPATTEKAKETEDKNNEDLKITTRLVNWGFEAVNERKIDTIIIHTSYNISGDPYDVEKVIREYKDYGVSPHYLIDRKGNTFLLVKENNVAYHAGVSQVPDGRTDVNRFSIGIELLNTKTDKPTSEQYIILNQLVDLIKNKYKIKYILGHNQIAPERKDDPWNFDWKKLK
jgi:hypothetical protein